MHVFKKKCISWSIITSTYYLRYFIIWCSSWWRTNSYRTMNLDETLSHQVRLKFKVPPKVKKANHFLCVWQDLLMLNGISLKIIYLDMPHHLHVVQFVILTLDKSIFWIYTIRKITTTITFLNICIFFWVDFMFGLLLRIIKILKLKNFENLYKFINNDERFECWMGDQCLVMKIQ